MRLTVACPEALRDDANQLAMLLAEGAADASTYDALNWQDAAGNLYACASFVASREWIEGATGPLQRPEWDTEEIIDMAAAARAQQALVVWMGGDDPVPHASPDALTVVAGGDALASVAAMGLVAVQGEPV